MSKRLIPYLLLSVLPVSVVFYLSILIHFNLLGITFLYIIPVGGIAVALVVGGCAYAALLKDNARCSIATAVFVGLFAGLVVLGLTYLDYATCFVDAGNKINHLFRGEHISSYQIDGMALDFSGYVKVFYLQMQMEIISRIRPLDPSFTGVTVFGVVFYVLQYIVAAGGSALAVLGVNDEPRCPVCDKYYKETEIDTFGDPERAEAFIRYIIDKQFAGGRYQPVKESDKDGYIIKMVARYCPECAKGEIWVKRSKIKSLDEKTLEKHELDRDQLIFLGLL